MRFIARYSQQKVDSTVWYAGYPLSTSFKRQQLNQIEYSEYSASTLLYLWFFIPHNRSYIDFSNAGFRELPVSKKKTNRLLAISKKFVRKVKLYSLTRENVFTLRPGYQLYWALLRSKLNCANGLFYRSHIRVSKWVEVYANHTFNKKLLPLEAFFFGKQNRINQSTFSKQSNPIISSKEKPIFGVYNRGFNWNWRV